MWSTQILIALPHSNGSLMSKIIQRIVKSKQTQNFLLFISFNIVSFVLLLNALNASMFLLF